MAFCANCGKEMSDLATACPNCGHPAGGAARAPAQNVGAYAEWWQRAVAGLIDGVIVGIPGSIISSILGIGFAASAKIDPATGTIESKSFFGGIIVMWIVFLAVAGAYRIILEGGPKGQTVGKMAMKIQVRNMTTMGPLGYGKAAARWAVASVLWLLFYIPGIIDVLMPLWDSKKQTIHDKAAGTVVVIAP
jgi:uncharacterized RDD family membrane protein YckC